MASTLGGASGEARRSATAEEDESGVIRSLLDSGGFELKGIRVGRAPGMEGGRGLFTLPESRVRKGDLLLSVFRKRVLTSDEAAESKLCARLPPRARRSAVQVLTAFLIGEAAKRDSPWRQMIELYPSLESFDTLPLFWTAKERLWLKGSRVAAAAVDRGRQLRGEFDACRHVLPRGTSYDAYLRMRLCVGSRCFGIKVDGRATTACVAIADMPNHASPSDAGWTFDKSLNAFVLRANRDIQPGRQIFISYGRKSNRDLLLFYGFCLQGVNKSDVASVDVHFGPLCRRRTLIIRRNSHRVATPALSYLRMACAFVNARGAPPDISKLFRVRRKAKKSKLGNGGTASCAPPKSLDEVIKISDSHLENCRCDFVSVDVERMAMTTLCYACERELKQYPTTLEQDKKLRNSVRQGTKSLTIRELFALRLRMGEKRVLQWQVEVCKLVERLVCGCMAPKKDREWASRTDVVKWLETRPIYKRSGACRQYIADVWLKNLSI